MPGTLRNDQFPDDWSRYFDAIEAATPAVAVLGITDYFTLRGYKRFVAERGSRLPDVAFVFANVELRLGLQTRDGNGVNLHLLVSPDDPDHVARLEEQLAKLTFKYRHETYPCTDESLRRLGRVHRGEPRLDDEAALSTGANQFKVDLDELQALFQVDKWLRSNVLVAVASGNDGLRGLADDASFKASREELGRFAHIVFSGKPGDRTYWLGETAALASDKQLPKPCLHGCDAHSLDRVLAPDLERRCWILGDASFETLRQTLVEPARRVWVGDTAPAGSQADQAIAEVEAGPGTWLKTPKVALNPGLVTVIGARGSGKTALADLLALGAGAMESIPGPASFIGKAAPLLGDIGVALQWGDGTQDTRRVGDGPSASPRALYLSQQFVERLSAPEGLTEPLLDEIERVVFGAIPEDQRLQTGSFEDLRDVVLEGPHAARRYERGRIEEWTAAIAADHDLERQLPALRQRAQQATRAREGLEGEIAKVPMPASKEKVEEHKQASLAVTQLQEGIAVAERRQRSLHELAAESRRLVDTAERQWEAMRSRFAGVVSEDVWRLLKPRLAPDAIKEVEKLEALASGEATSLRQHGTPVPPAAAPPPGRDAGLAETTARRDALTKELGLDEANARRKIELEQRLPQVKAAEAQALAVVANAEGAAARAREAGTRRSDAYRRVFETLDEEADALRGIYSPLRDRAAQDRRLAKLTFSVERVVDHERWAAAGEELFDLRRPPLAGRGTLAAKARETLLGAWTGGSADEVASAMRAFYDEIVRPAYAHLALGVSARDVGNWFYATDHISVRYGIEYEGVPIGRLSPGTRGVVLLTLYLGLDSWDTRPMIIDQPEENLDPSSIYAELVPFFRDAAARRQIIMVTHNANLVVNTDSDQVIIASSVRPSPRSLPEVSYTAGGLERPEIREAICRLLEGGEEAFVKRERRYGLH